MSKDGQAAGSGFALLARICAVLLGLALVVDRADAYSDVTFVLGDARANVLRVFAFWAALLGPGLYVCALWAIGNVFSRIKRGDSFGPTLVRGLRETGLNLLLGSLAVLVLAPGLAWYAGLEAQAPTLEARIVNLAFFFIGVAFFMLARKGAAMKSELEQFV